MLEVNVSDEERITAAVEVNDRRVTLEGPRSFVEAEVRRLTSGIVALPAAVQQQAHRPESSEGLSERDFVALKNPRGHLEIVAVLGLYLTERGQVEFTEEDIRRAYSRAAL